MRYGNAEIIFNIVNNIGRCYCFSVLLKNKNTSFANSETKYASNDFNAIHLNVLLLNNKSKSTSLAITISRSYLFFL